MEIRKKKDRENERNKTERMGRVREESDGNTKRERINEETTRRE